MEVIHILVGDSEEKILIIVCAANMLGSPDLLYIGARQSRMDHDVAILNSPSRLLTYNY